MRQMPFVGPSIGYKKDEEGLYNQRNGYQQDMQGILQDRLALKREQDHQCQQQSSDGITVKTLDKYLIEIVDTFMADNCLPCEDAGS